MKRLNKKTTERYHVAMATMYNKPVFDPVDICRGYNITVSLGAELRKLGQITRDSQNEWRWIGPPPDKDIATLVHKSINNKARSRYKKVEAPEIAPLFVSAPDTIEPIAPVKDRTKLYYLAGKYGIAPDRIEQFIQDIELL